MNIKDIMASLEAKHPGDRSIFKLSTRYFYRSRKPIMNTPNLKKLKS